MLRLVAQSPVTPRPSALLRPRRSQVPTNTLAWQQQRWMLLLLAPSDDPTGNAGHGCPTGNAGHDRPTGKCRARLPDRINSNPCLATMSAFTRHLRLAAIRAPCEHTPQAAIPVFFLPVVPGPVILR
ncbi:unnamed protein product [Parnassius apollo]|uniref:(apollo) hypothetical protein n=1 Tax=Parnassius apollo TaxID=110799 RepID=A0A8S3YEV5_PARAO|nr:unnamed protein product [Parnassius apollo]